MPPHDAPTTTSVIAYGGGIQSTALVVLAAAARERLAPGCRSAVTYTQTGERGSSLRGSRSRVVERPPRLGWSTPSQPRPGSGVDGIAWTLWESTP